MRKTFFFQYEVKPEYTRVDSERTIDVLIEWRGEFYTSQRAPMVWASFPTLGTYDLKFISDWPAVISECEEIGERHFAEIAKQEEAKAHADKIAEARALLQEYENPVLERMAPAY